MPEEEKKKLIIDRSRWYRGLGEERSALLRLSDGKMCCLGFVGLACGYTPGQIGGRGDPQDVTHDLPSLWPKELLEYGNNSQLTADLVKVNDSPFMGDHEREEQIMQLLWKAGFDVEFEGEDWRSSEAILAAKAGVSHD